MALFRRWLLGLGLMPAFVFGQSFPGAKADPISNGSGSAASGFGPLLNVLVALGIVYVLLRFLMPKLLVRMNRRLVTAAGSDIRIEESASFAGGSLYVVSARGKALLLAVNAQGVQCLSDVSDARPEPAPVAFHEMVEAQMQRSTPEPEHTQDPVPAPDLRSSEPEPEDGIAVALRRLERLAN